MPNRNGASLKNRRQPNILRSVSKYVAGTSLHYGLAGSLVLGGCFVQAPSSQPTDITVNIGGSAETYETLEVLAEAYKATAPEVEFNFFPPSQTSGGIQGVKSGLIDIGGVSREPDSDEITDQLTYFRLTKIPLVVVVHESVTGIDTLTSEQLKAIYSGRITNWKTLGGPDAEIVLFDFTEDENEKQVLRQTYLGDTLTITPNAIVFPEDDEVVETAAITKFSMAAVAYENEVEDLAQLNILSINDVTPSTETIQSGQYPMTLPLGVMVNDQPSSIVWDFLKFATSPKGQQILNDTSSLLFDAS
ncbi:MAG: substrate-binding domain-containing protein [Leptolyngbyaceae cyanobacterium]